MTGRIFKWGEKRQDGDATIMDGVARDGTECRVSSKDGEHTLTMRFGDKKYGLRLLAPKADTTVDQREDALCRVERSVESTLRLLQLYGTTECEHLRAMTGEEWGKELRGPWREWDERMEWPR
jgi:hypothetical protein